MFSIILQVYVHYRVSSDKWSNLAQHDANNKRFRNKFFIVTNFYILIKFPWSNLTQTKFKKTRYTQPVFISCILEKCFYTHPLEDHIDDSFLFLL